MLKILYAGSPAIAAKPLIEIEHSKKHDYWPDRSKGYDDWLLTLRKQEAVRQNGHPLP